MPPDTDTLACLNGMSATQMRDFAEHMQMIAMSANVLEQLGFLPVFDLTPGQRPKILLDITMPSALPSARPAQPQLFTTKVTDGVPGPWHPYPDTAQPEPAQPEPAQPEPAQPEPARPEQHPEGVEPGGDSDGGADGSAASPAAPEPVLSDMLKPGVIIYGAIDHLGNLTPNHPAFRKIPAQPDPELPVASRWLEAPETARQDAQEQPDGADEPRPVGSPLDVTPTPEPDNPVTPGSARALAQGNRPPLWTEAEDARAIALAVAIPDVLGLSMNSIAMRIAPDLGRPVPGTAYRLQTKLMPLIRAALKTGQTPPAATPAPVEVPALVEAAASAAAPRVIPKGVPDTDLFRHLTSLPYKGKWTVQDDRTLFDLLCTGLPADAIAAEMDIGRQEVIARFDLLTGYDRDSKARRFPRDAVLEALILITAQTPA